MMRMTRTPRHALSMMLAIGLLAVGCDGDQGKTGAERDPAGAQASKPTSTPSTPAPAETTAPAKASAARPDAPVTTSDNPTLAPTPGTVLRDTELKDKPFLDAKTLGTLKARTSLVILERQSGWLRVKAGEGQGWVRLLSVSTEPAGRAGASRDLESVTKLATGRAGSGNIATTTGIRGLNEEQLKTAQPAPEEVKKLESYATSKEAAADYARQHKLAARQVPFLANPP